MYALPHAPLAFCPTRQQVNAAPQYTAVQAAGGHNNGGTVFLTTDYITYRDYYSTAPAAQSVTPADQYQTVRQHLSAAPANVTYPQVTNVEAAGETSFLDRYLRQPVATSTANGNGVYKQTTMHGGLTVDLPSPDSGIGEATITPRGENGALPQVR